MTNIKNLTNRVYEKLSLKGMMYKWELREILEFTFKELRDMALQEEERVRIKDFGIFSPRTYQGIFKDKAYKTRTIKFRMLKKNRIKE